jgi:hypothetical protein
MHSYQFVPAQTDRGVPWALEVNDIMQGVPKTSRIPTGGWRTYGAVPSHSYPYESSVPGYWQGAGNGMVASTVEAQSAKTFGTVPDPSACPAGYAMNAEGKCVAVAGASSGGPAWLTDIAKAMASVYTTYTMADIQRDLIKKGVSPAQAPVAAQQVVAMQAAGAGGTNWLLWGGVAAAGLAAVAWFARGKRR